MLMKTLAQSKLGSHLSNIEDRTNYQTLKDLASLVPFAISSARDIPVRAHARYKLGLYLTSADGQPSYQRLKVLVSLIPFILSNAKLNPKIIPPFLERVNKEPSFSHLSEESQALEALLQHKVIVADVKLFKKTWIVTQAIRPSSTRKARLLHECIILSDVLYYHSAIASGHVSKMPIATLLFIMAHFANVDDQDLTPDFKILRTESLEVRHDEIKAWVGKHMPDCINLPLSWVFQVYDLYSD